MEIVNNFMNTHFTSFVKKISSPISFGFFLATKLPAAFFVGLRLNHIDENTCTIGIRHSWFSKNPFKSMYFAAEAMAAEMSTGLLAFGHLYQQNTKVSMLVVKMEASYFKKGTGKLQFTCANGALVHNAISETMKTGEGVTLITKSIGKNENNEVVAEFNFTWSFKAKK
jgi:hypothetical protein